MSSSPVHVAASIRAALLGGGSIHDTEKFGHANEDAVGVQGGCGKAPSDEIHLSNQKIVKTPPPAKKK